MNYKGIKKVYCEVCQHEVGYTINNILSGVFKDKSKLYAKSYVICPQCKTNLYLDSHYIKDSEEE